MRHSARTPLLSTRRISLQPVTAEDHRYVHWLETQPENLWYWRSGGQIEGPTQHAQRLWQGVLAQFCIIDGRAREIVGLVLAYNANFRDGHVYLAALGDKSAQDGRIAEAALLFGNYCFESWPFRKIYIESLAPNWASFRHLACFLDGMAEVEARFSEFAWAGGKYEDKIVASVSRERWVERRPSLESIFNGHTQVSTSRPAEALDALGSLIPGLDAADGQATLQDLGADSLTVVEVAMILEGHGIPAEGIYPDASVDYLRERLRSGAAG